MVLSIHIGCMQGSKYIRRVSRLIQPQNGIFQGTCALQHSSGNISAEKSNGFLCRCCSSSSSSSSSDRHGHWESSAPGLRGHLYRLCYRCMLYFPPSVLSMAPQDLWMRWLCSCWASGECIMLVLFHLPAMEVLTYVFAVHQCCPAIHPLRISWPRMWNVSLSCTSRRRAILTINRHINRLSPSQVSEIQKVRNLSSRAMCDIMP